MTPYCLPTRSSPGPAGVPLRARVAGMVLLLLPVHGLPAQEASSLPPLDRMRLATLRTGPPVQILHNQTNEGMALWQEWANGAWVKPELPVPTSAEVGAGWSGYTISTSASDGMQIQGGSFNGSQIIFNVSVPYFYYNGVRYELTSARRTSGPTLRRYVDNSVRAESAYSVPVTGGTVLVTQVYYLGNRAGDAPGHLKPWVVYSGPAGTYDWYIRMDFDLRGAAGDRYQEFQTSGARTYWIANATEYSHGSGAPYWNNLKTRSWDETGADRLNRILLGVRPHAPDGATHYVVRYHALETEGLPATYVNGETLQTLNASTPAAPTAGNDLVHWYVGTRATASGVVGPDIEVGNQNPRQCFVEIDKLSSVSYPPQSVSHNGCTFTMESMYAGLIELRVVRDQGSIADPHPGTGFTEAELHDLMTANRTYWGFQQDLTHWYAYIVIVTRLGSGGTLGIMFDWTADPNNVAREGCAVFHSAFSYSEPTLSKALLRTQAHELGHVFNLQHSDGALVGSAPWTCTEGYTIMNQTGSISPFPDAILYDFSASSRNKLTTWHDHFIMPGGVPFTGTP